MKWENLLNNFRDRFLDTSVERRVTLLINDLKEEIDPAIRNTVVAFLRDEIEMAEAHRTFAEKWSPTIFHENVALEASREIEASTALIEMLEEL